MWEKIKAATRAMVKNPLRFFFDPGYMLEFQTKEMAEEGRSPEEIEVVLKTEGFVKGSPIVEGVERLAKAVSSGLNFIFTNLPQILLAVVLLFVAWYVLKFSKIVKAAT